MDEAVERARPYAVAGDRLALNFFARLLTRHDRGDEAFALLSTEIDDWYLAGCLVDVAGVAGLDEEAAALLEGRVEGVPGCDNRRTVPSDAVGLLATVRERQGRVEEAIALLHTRTITSVNGRDQLADLLVRNDRIDDLRAYAAVEHHGDAARALAEALEERGDVDGAIAVYRQLSGSSVHRYNCAVLLSELLARHGRGGEAIEVMRAVAESSGGDDWINDTLCTLYADQGRAREGLAHLDGLKVRRGGEEEWDLFRLRLPLMAALGLLDEAVELARAHPENSTWYAAEGISGLLAEAGCTEEAAAVLEPHLPSTSSLLARHLIDLGRVEDAIGVLQTPRATPPTPVPVNPSVTEPPF